MILHILSKWWSSCHVTELVGHVTVVQEETIAHLVNTFL